MRHSCVPQAPVCMNIFQPRLLSRTDTQTHRCLAARPWQASSLRGCFPPSCGAGRGGGDAGCCLCPSIPQRPHPHPPAARSSRPVCPATADTHSSGLVEHELLDRADDGSSGRGHGSSQWRPHYRAPGRSPGRDSCRTVPGDRGRRLCRARSPDPAEKNQTRSAKALAAAAAGCFRIPRVTPPIKPRPHARGGVTTGVRRC